MNKKELKELEVLEEEIKELRREIYFKKAKITEIKTKNKKSLLNAFIRDIKCSPKNCNGAGSDCCHKINVTLCEGQIDILLPLYLEKFERYI